MSADGQKKKNLKTSEKNGDVEIVNLVPVVDKKIEEVKISEKPDEVASNSVLDMVLKNVSDNSTKRRLGVREVKVAGCSLVFLLSMMVIVMFSAPPYTESKMIAIYVTIAIGLVTCLFISISSLSNMFIKEYILALLGTEEDERKQFLLSVITMDESRDLYIRDSGIRVDKSVFEIENATPFTVGDDLVVEFSFREMLHNQFCRLTLDSIPYRDYSATDEKGRARMISERLDATTKAFNLFR